MNFTRIKLLLAPIHLLILTHLILSLYFKEFQIYLHLIGMLHYSILVQISIKTNFRIFCEKISYIPQKYSIQNHLLPLKTMHIFGWISNHFLQPIYDWSTIFRHLDRIHSKEWFWVLLKFLWNKIQKYHFDYHEGG